MLRQTSCLVRQWRQSSTQENHSKSLFLFLILFLVASVASQVYAEISVNLSKIDSLILEPTLEGILCHLEQETARLGVAPRKKMEEVIRAYYNYISVQKEIELLALQKEKLWEIYELKRIKAENAEIDDLDRLEAENKFILCKISWTRKHKEARDHLLNILFSAYIPIIWKEEQNEEKITTNLDPQ